MGYEKEYADFCKKLGMRIKNLREEKKLSLEELSLITNINIKKLKNLESGCSERIFFDKHLLKISNALNVDIGLLFEF